LLHHAPGSLLAAGWAAFALWLKPMFFYRSLPVAIPLILAAAMSVMLSRGELGQRLERWGLLLTAEAGRGCQQLEGLSNNRLAASHQPNFCETVIHPGYNELQAALARRGRTGLRRQRLQALRRRCI